MAKKPEDGKLWGEASSEVVVQRHKGFSGSESPSPTICLPSVGVTDFPSLLPFFYKKVK